MSTIHTVREGYVCVDCALLIANDDDSGAPEGHRARVAEYFGTLRMVVLGDDEGFMRPFNGCMTCGSRLAGDYFEASELSR